MKKISVPTGVLFDRNLRTGARKSSSRISQLRVFPTYDKSTSGIIMAAHVERVKEFKQKSTLRFKGRFVAKTKVCELE